MLYDSGAHLDMNDLADQTQRLIQLVKDAGIAHRQDDVLRVARPSVRLFTTRIEGEVPVGTSRMGGAPDLPEGVDWPRHGDVDMGFLVQLNLAEVAAVLPDSPLPRDGLLSFFAVVTADHDDYGTVGKVIHAPVGIPLAPLPVPDSPEKAYAPQYPAAIELRVELSVPAPGGAAIEAVNLGEKNADNPKYWDGVWMHRNVHDRQPCHRLLGHPDMNFTYHLGDGDLLLQVDADDAAYFEFGDCQPLRFEMPSGALARHAWDEVILNGDEE